VHDKKLKENHNVLSSHDTLFETKFHENQAISVYMMYEFETGDVRSERKIQDFHKRDTTNGKLATIRDNNCTYSKIPLYRISIMSIKTVSLSAGTFNQ
jgi:hypothetical protein